MEYLDGLLHKDVLIVIVETFYSVVVLAFSDSAVYAGLPLVAICIGVACIFVSIYRVAVCSKLKVGNPEETQILLFAHHILCASPIVRLGKYDGNIKVALFKRLNDNGERIRRLFLFA